MTDESRKHESLQNRSIPSIAAVGVPKGGGFRCACHFRLLVNPAEDRDRLLLLPSTDVVSDCLGREIYGQF